MGWESNENRLVILLITLNLNVSNIDGHFFQYSMSFNYENEQTMEAKGNVKRIIENARDI